MFQVEELMGTVHHFRLHDGLLEPHTGVFARLEESLDSDSSSILSEVFELFLGLCFITTLLNKVINLFFDDMESIDSGGVLLSKILKVYIDQIIETDSSFTDLLICGTIHDSKHNLLLVITDEGLNLRPSENGHFTLLANHYFLLVLEPRVIDLTKTKVLSLKVFGGRLSINTKEEVSTRGLLG